MQFKYPKKITIGNVEFEMKYNPKDGGGSFSYPFEGKKGFIEIGTEDLKSNPLSFLNILIHELKEIIQVEQSTRFKRVDGGDYEFHYTHKEHTDLCSRLSGLLTQFIK